MKFVKNTIRDFLRKYQNKIDQIDLEILLADVIKKSREFVLAYPEYKLTQKQELKIKNFIERRIKEEPVAYIVGHKEFYGLNFKVNKHTLIPRPETELMIDEALKHLNNSCGNYKLQPTSYKLIDIGTGSGNIAISIAKNLPKKLQTINYNLIATDISKEALKIAKQNAQKHNVAEKITFLQSDLLNSFEFQIFNFNLKVNDKISKTTPLSHLKNKNLKVRTLSHSKFNQNSKFKIQNSIKLVILANLPYLSAKIYNSCAKNVKNFEPKNALFSPNAGLAHYEKLFHQINEILAENHNLSITIFLEISPEQKKTIKKLIEKHFPKVNIKFKKDLAGKWRMCKTEINFAK